MFQKNRVFAQETEIALKRVSKSDVNYLDIQHLEITRCCQLWSNAELCYTLGSLEFVYSDNSDS